MKFKQSIIAALVLAQGAFATNLYVTPWYANPSPSTVAYDARAVSSLNENTAPLSTAWATVASDANVAGRTILAKRMSHTDYFRPRLYALRDDGAIIIYTLSKDLSSIVWTTVYSSADLIARMNVNGGSLAAGQTITAFEVVDKDGATAFVQFDNTGRWLAIANSSPKWTYYTAGASGNPSTNDVACITDGRWVIKVTQDTYGLMLGTWTNPDIAYATDFMAEFLDFSAGTAKVLGEVTWNINIMGNLYGLGADALGRHPRVLIHSPKFSVTAFRFDGWQVEELALGGDGATLGTFGSWNACQSASRIVIDFPRMTTVQRYAMYGNWSMGAGTCGDASDFADFHLPVVTSVGEYGFFNLRGRGSLDLPSLVSVGNNAFYGCDNMEEVSLGTKNNTLATLATKSFAAYGASGSLKRVTLGCADGFGISAADIFEKQPLEVVIFTGAIPSFNVATAWPDAAANTMVFAIPEGNAASGAIAENATPLTDSERRAYHAAHPANPVPFGIVDANVFATHYAQYVAYVGSDTGYSLTVERNTSFDDAVTISADALPFADGTYPSGTTVTLTATPNATGTFRKWYGDVARVDRANSTISITLTNNVWLYARIVHPWTLAADKLTATDGIFTINCSVLNESAKTLKIGKDWGIGMLFADTSTGAGICDLGGTVSLESDGTQYTFAKIPDGSQSMIGNGSVTGLLTPGTFLAAFSINANSESFNCWNAESKSYRLLIIDEPTCGWTWAKAGFAAYQRSLTHLIIESP